MLTLQIFVFFGVLSLCSGNNRFNRTRAAIVITLAGKNKLSEYFEWSCRSIGNAAAFYDMLVFHESNTKVKELHCAPNVKLIDLGENGLSAVIGSRMMNVDMNDKEDVGTTRFEAEYKAITLMRYVNKAIKNETLAYYAKQIQ